MRNFLTFTLLLITLLLSSVICVGQKADSLLLRHTESLSTSSITDLSELVSKLTDPYSSQEDQFRSIYLWLIHNIEYDYVALNNERINQNNQDILDRGKAICWGYATLLKSMCEQVGIPIVVLTGYVRTHPKETPFLKYPNHAWNAVQLNGTWQLVDATWDSQHLSAPSLFFKKFNSNYYLTDPTYFITNHLPADPQWQLLSCPISIQDFQLPIDSMVQLAQNKDCDTILSSPSSYVSLTYFDQQLQKAINTFQFNPTDENRRELASTQIEYQDHLSEKAEQLQVEQKIDSLLTIQRQMIELCEVASSLTELYDTQKENCAYNYFNHAVALSQVKLTAEEEQNQLVQMLHYFQLATTKLKTLPQNIFIEQALLLSTDYISYLEERLEK